MWDEQGRRTNSTSSRNRRGGVVNGIRYTVNGKWSTAKGEMVSDQRLKERKNKKGRAGRTKWNEEE